MKRVMHIIVRAWWTEFVRQPNRMLRTIFLYEHGVFEEEAMRTSVE